MPYVVWNLIALALDYAKYMKGSVSWLDYSQSTIGQIFYQTFLDYMPINLPLWYVRDLIILLIVSPLIVKLIRKVPILTFGLMAGWYFLDTEPFIISSVSLLFFSIGVYLGDRHYTLVVYKTLFYRILLGGVVSMVLYKALSVNWAFDCYRLFMPFAFIFMISYVINCFSSYRTALVGLSKYSQIIYYSHFPITLIFSIKIVSWVLPSYTMLNYMVIPVFAALASMALQHVLDRCLAVKIKSSKR